MQKEKTNRMLDRYNESVILDKARYKIVMPNSTESVSKKQKKGNALR